MGNASVQSGPMQRDRPIPSAFTGQTTDKHSTLDHADDPRDDFSMLDQLALGSAITFVSMVIAAVMWWGMSTWLERHEHWFQRPPYYGKSAVVIGLVVLVSMLMMTMGVWLWAFVLLKFAAFQTLEEAVFYALVAYTTLGLGEASMPIEWRLLGGMTGANGFLMFGLMTAMLTDTLRQIRRT